MAFIHNKAKLGREDMKWISNRDELDYFDGKNWRDNGDGTITLAWLNKQTGQPEFTTQETGMEPIMIESTVVETPSSTAKAYVSGIQSGKINFTSVPESMRDQVAVAMAQAEGATNPSIYNPGEPAKCHRSLYWFSKYPFIHTMESHWMVQRYNHHCIITGSST